MRRCIRGDAAPDRYVNNYEALSLGIHPALMMGRMPEKGGPAVVDAWGVTREYPADNPAAFPVHTPDKIVVKDIESWRDYVHAPQTDFPDELWAFCKEKMYDTVDTTRSFKGTLYVSGLFEMSHYLCSIADALTYFVTNPDEMHDMIKYLTEYELRVAEGICKNLKPELLFHHDDWGTENTSFLSPAMFEDFFLDAYKEIYQYYHAHGVEFVVHHSDSFCANLVDSMVEMGVDVWQGCMQSNDVRSLVKKYKGKMTFMGDIDNKAIDFKGWTREDCRKAATRAMEGADLYGFIPCITQGLAGTIYPGAYETLVEEVDAINSEKFGFTLEELAANRVPMRLGL